MAQEAYGFLYPVKERKENGPVLSGTAILNGMEVKVAGWSKIARNGTKYLSLKFEDYEVDASAVPEPADDDLPF